MIGAGVFSAFSPAAQSAGSWLLVSLAVAALVAWLNAISSAQLAAQFPTSGGTYAFGREMLGPWWGYLAGWSFVVGKLASSAAIALTFAAYVLPQQWQRPGAIAAIALLTFVNMRGITRTAALAILIVVPVIVVLTLFIGLGIVDATDSGVTGSEFDIYGILQAAGLLFFAFAGYARLATLGEEVQQPHQNIPRAIVISLVIVLALYAGVGWSLLHILGANTLASSSQPLLDAVESIGLGSWGFLIVVAAALATIGSLLALIAGISRTMFAMARNDDLPRWLAATHAKFQVPHRAELFVGVMAILLVSVSDLRSAVGFSSAGVLLYYFITNISALRQDQSHRRFARVWSALGAVMCAGLAFTLPITSLVAALIVIATGIAYRVFHMNRIRLQK